MWRIKMITDEPRSCCLCGKEVWNGIVYEITWGDPDTYVCDSCFRKIASKEAIQIRITKKKAIEIQKRRGIPH
jgi:ribosome-binding protein aMBF1 (putative translation factor)